MSGPTSIGSKVQDVWYGIPVDRKHYHVAECCCFMDHSSPAVLASPCQQGVRLVALRVADTEHDLVPTCSPLLTEAATYISCSDDPNLHSDISWS